MYGFYRYVLCVFDIFYMGVYVRLIEGWIMTKKEDVKSYFKYTLGSGSHLNLFGKIVFSPLILLFGFCFGLAWFILEFLFSKKVQHND